MHRSRRRPSAACAHHAHHRPRARVRESDGHYSIAFGLTGYALSVSKKELLTGFFYNMAAGMVTNCVKLIPLGQQDGQQILFSLHPLIDELVTV
ncbi:MAG: hypothetical protein H7099_15765, partial [Gemmatimonadaceae bacterium]|nr:hypothetical protein [Gemmatimonadaceae bacterium]